MKNPKSLWWPVRTTWSAHHIPTSSLTSSLPPSSCLRPPHFCWLTRHLSCLCPNAPLPAITQLIPSLPSSHSSKVTLLGWRSSLANPLKMATSPPPLPISLLWFSFLNNSHHLLTSVLLSQLKGPRVQDFYFLYPQGLEQCLAHRGTK